MIEHLLVADPNPGNELLLEVMNSLYFEALVMSAGYANGYPKSDLEYHESKLGTTCLLARVLQEEIGLRFRTMHMPFCLPPALALPGGYPMAGYLDDYPDLSPNPWIAGLFVRWHVQDHMLQRWKASGKDIRHNSMMLETRYLLRCALWYCLRTNDQDAVMAAVQLVAELVGTGQVRDAMGAAMAISVLLRTEPALESPRDLVSAFFGGSIPVTAEDWKTSPLTWSNEESRPLSRGSQRAVNWLVQYVQSTVDRVRQAPNFDAWFAALTMAGSVINSVTDGLRWSIPKVPIGLRAVLAQWEELAADLGPQLMLADIGGMPAVIGSSRDMAERYLRIGDTTGERFARERMLIPRELFESRGPLPVMWRRPSYRMATAWFHGRRLNGRGLGLDLSPDLLELPSDDTVMAEIRRLSANGELARAAEAVDALLERFPWYEAAHRSHAELSMRIGQLDKAMHSVVAGLVLEPRLERYWQLLSTIMRHQGNLKAATVADKLVYTLHDSST